MRRAVALPNADRYRALESTSEVSLPTIADSSAFKDRERVLPQHQAALTLLQARLSTPDTSQRREASSAVTRERKREIARDEPNPDGARQSLPHWIAMSPDRSGLRIPNGSTSS